MLRGEVWWAVLPSAAGGRKGRPMLVVSDDAFNRNDRYPKVLVIHLTSVKRLGAQFDWEVAIARGTAGLPKASIAKCAEVYTFLKPQFQKRLGMLPSATLGQVDRALALSLGLPPPR